MIVIFISECEKNALKKTRQVLDSFANRIGHRTWKTVITNEGLKAVKTLLSKTASRSSAVSCHWIRSYSQTELIWVVGNRSKFNSQGFVPVNITQKEIVNTAWENDWNYLPLIKSLSALAGLFHDFGKSSLCFQEKLKNAVDSTKSGKNLSDPLRHEWISCLIFKSFVAESNHVSDENWLSSLASGEIKSMFKYSGSNEAWLNKEAQNISKSESDAKPLQNLPDAAGLIAWLILSHHKMPCIFKDKDELLNLRNRPAESLAHILSMITQEWGYQNRYDDDKNYQKILKKCFEFPEGLPSQSAQWQKNIKRWSSKMLECLPLLVKAMNDGSWRLVLHHARLCLMVGDHSYSSQNADSKWQGNLNLFANTDKHPFTKKRIFKQRLDEHLVGVTQNALNLAHFLPAFENQFRFVEDVRELKKKSPSDSKYRWQDKAVEKIKIWQEQSPAINKSTNRISNKRDTKDSDINSETKNQQNRYGFFIVNMASTGCGKTLANAKVMQALSKDGESLRYVLALGLRTLTLQTGDEYRERIHLDETELAVVIGSKAVKELHERKSELNEQNRESRKNSAYNKITSEEHYQESDDYEQAGSESIRSLLDEEVHYEGNIPVNNLTTILTSENHKKFLYAPVLVCTIDHLMPGTETKRGGHYMLPALRLLSSDLVIDEVDDFNGNDLIAIGRLVHLAGMSGCKVMISSATIPPDLAEGYFNAYREGWSLYSKSRDASTTIGCCWIDEFNTRIESVGAYQSGNTLNSDYQKLHEAFINKRVVKLKVQPVKRKANIVDCKEIVSNRELTIEQAYFEKIREAIVEKHLQHNTIYKKHNPTDERTVKKISFGVVRVAHIKTCISLADYLIKAQWGENFAPKIMAYHSRQVLLLRSEQEKHLDQVLKRKEKQGQEPEAFQNYIIRNHIEKTNAENLIFILVATPVEEVGRDHDFDWAVVEPSSFRSIIQLAGRVMRHRDANDYNIGNKEPNIALMQYNLKALEYAIENGDGNRNITIKPAYCNPGYEGVIQEGGSRFNLITHDLKQLLDESMIAQIIDAVPRIQRNKDLKELADKRLADLEHYVIHNLLTMYDKVGPESMQGWLTQKWWLTAIPQSLTKFRESRPEIKLHLVYENYEPLYSSFGKPVFIEIDSKGNHVPREEIYRIKHKTIDKLIDLSNKNRLWLERDYLLLLESIEYEKGIPIRTASIRYGEISLPDDSNKQYEYSDQFGLQEVKD